VPIRPKGEIEVTFSKYSGRAVFLLAVLPLILSAQSARDNVIPLKNWDTPLYWHPNPAERAAANPVPQLQPVNDVPQTPLTFVGMTPCRLVDTRGAAVGFDGNAPFSGGPGPIAASATVPFPVLTYNMNTTPAPCGPIALVAEAYSLNVTIIPVTTLGSVYVEVWPDGTPAPGISTLNDPEATVVANSLIIAGGTPNGGINVFNYGPGAINVIIDMNGYFVGPSSPSGNTGLGTGTLADNTAGYYNTAVGATALNGNTSGDWNTASGAFALGDNTTGEGNTANGSQALNGNTTGNYNTASGEWALITNTTGGYNTANGSYALFSNTTGGYNTAIGSYALASIITGGNTSGGYNIGIGSGAGNMAPGFNSNSIYIGSNGSTGDSAGTIQVGTQGTQTGGTFIAGIYGAPHGGGMEVFVNNNGQLTTVPSSSRFKEQITDMGDSSSKLLQLRPVNFYYKPEFDDGSRQLQYGLIAEDVAKIYPEMVAYANDGQVLSVKYQLLAPMLLNELQKQAEQNRQQAENIRSQAENIRSLEDRLAALEAGVANRSPSGTQPVQ
jgi:hypothetical protein